MTATIFRFVILSAICCSFSSFSYPPYQHIRKYDVPFENERAIILKMTYKVSVKGHLDKMRFKISMPGNVKNRQTINDMSFSIEPDSIYSNNGNWYALFKLYDIDKSFKITAKYDMTLYRRIDQVNTDTLKNGFSQYLISEKFIESNNIEIKKVAAELKQKTDIETAMKTYEYVKEHITYKIAPAVGATEVLESGEGKCMDFSDLLNALLRANNIPAKSMHGMTVEYSLSPFHAWSEVYLKKQGWVLFDPTTGQTDIQSDGKNFVMRIKNKYIILSEGRNNKEVEGRYAYQAKGSDDCKVDVKILFDMIPK